MQWALFPIFVLGLMWACGTRLKKPDAWTFNILYLSSVVWLGFYIITLLKEFVFK